MTCDPFLPDGSRNSPVFITPEVALAKMRNIGGQITNIKTIHHDRGNVRTILQSLNSLITQTDLTDWPNLRDRIQAYGPLTIADVTGFLDFSGITETRLIDTLEDATIRPTPTVQLESVYSQLDFYYNENFAESNSESACANLASSIMQVVGFISAAVTTLDKLQNFGEFVQDMLSRLKNWKQMIFDMIDELKARLLDQISYFIDQINSIAFKVKEIAGRMRAKAQAVKSFLEDPSIDSIKEWVEGILAQIAGQFEEMNPEAIAHILLMVCQLSSSITAFMKSPLDGLKSVVSNYMIREVLISDFTYMKVGESASSGLPRLDPASAAATRKDISGGETSVGPYWRGADFSDEENSFLAKLSESGSFSGNGVTIDHASWVKSAENNPKYAKGEYAGYTKTINITPKLYVALYRIAKDMNKSFMVNSSFRSKQYQIDKGISGSGLHTKAGALDVSMNGLSAGEIATFIKLASREQLGAIVYYQSENFVHIDVGNRRHWLGVSRYPAAIKEASQRHLDGLPPLLGSIEADPRIFDQTPITGAS